MEIRSLSSTRNSEGHYEKPPGILNVKVVLIGNSNIGKSKLRHKLVFDEVPDKVASTIGSDFSIVRKTVDTSELILQMYDLSGNRKYSEERKRHYENADLAFLMFNVTDRNSFDDLPYWLDELTEYNNHRIIPFMVIGTEFDLDKKSPIENAELEEFLDSMSNWTNMDVPYFEVSSINFKVERIYETILNLIKS